MLRRILAVTIAAAATAVVFASPATAESTPDTDLILTITPDWGGAGSAVTLTCDPDGGTHPNASGACEVLDQVNGDVQNMNLDPGAACILIVDPHTVTATGHYRGTPVSVTRSFDNRCWMNVATGSLYDF